MLVSENFNLNKINFKKTNLINLKIKNKLKISEDFTNKNYEKIKKISNNLTYDYINIWGEIFDSKIKKKIMKIKQFEIQNIMTYGDMVKNNEHTKVYNLRTINLYKKIMSVFENNYNLKKIENNLNIMKQAPPTKKIKFFKTEGIYFGKKINNLLINKNILKFIKYINTINKIKYIYLKPLKYNIETIKQNSNVVLKQKNI
jgi:hypothetical protein